MNFKITKAGERHRSEIDRLVRDAKIGDKFPGPIRNAWIARVGDRIVGFGALDFINERAACLVYLVVEKEFRKHGIGSALIAKRIEHAKRRGSKVLALCTMYYRFNFYKRRGFKVVRRADLADDLRAYGQFTDARYMKCAVMINERA